MQFTFTLFLLSVGIASVCGGCLDALAPSKRENTQCSWYNDNSCCDETVASSVSEAYKCKLEDGCKEQLFLYACGLYCSPDISEALTAQSGLRVCSSFADKLYSSCKGSELEGADGTCKKLGDEYSDAKAWFQDSGGVIIYDEEDTAPKCFNSGSVVQPALFLAFVAVFVLLFKN